MFSAQNVHLAARTIVLSAGKTKQNKQKTKQTRTTTKHRELYLLQLEKARTILIATGESENHFCNVAVKSCWQRQMCLRFLRQSIRLVAPIKRIDLRV